MSEIIDVALGERAYPIVTGVDAMAQLAPRLRGLAPTGAAVVTDERVASLWGQQVMEELARATDGPRRLFAVPPGEAAKNPAQLAALWNDLAAVPFDRRAAVVALGGGVVGDLAGFAAATYLRGVRLVQIPTSLLAQVDSSVGGKTGVNLPAGKNLAGAFHQPSLVISDPCVLATLPPGEWSCGFAEAVKHGAALDADYFARLEADAALLVAARAGAGGDVHRPGGGPPRWRDEIAAAITRLVAGSCRLKAGVVSRDERETGERALLNFGHSFGHAYEKLSNYGLRHGEAVAKGMTAATRLSQRLSGLDPEASRRVRSLLGRLGLDPTPPGHPAASVVEAMRGDKKNEGGVFRLVLLKALGEARVVAVKEEELTRD